LIVLRIIAIWNRNKVVVAISSIVWGTNVAFLIQDVAVIRSEWAPNKEACAILNMHDGAHNFVIKLISDTILLLTMLVGLFRLNRGIRGSIGVGRLLWHQGVIWLLLADAAEIPPVVFLILNLNETWDIMFQLPALITLSIAATRLHRSLVEFVSGTTEIIQENAGGNTNLRVTWAPAGALHAHQIDFAVHTDYEEDVTSQMRHHSSHIDIDSQLSDQLAESRKELESGMEV